jgi:hypothetical protein
MQPLSSLLSGTQGDKGAESFGAMSPIERAVCWVRQNRLASGGIAVHHKSELATPEVTGYLIPSLLNAGDEAKSSYPNGRPRSEVRRVFDAPDGVPYVRYGASHSRLPLGIRRILGSKNVRRACDYVARHIDRREGRPVPRIGSWLTETFDEVYNLYAAAHQAVRLGEPRGTSSCATGAGPLQAKTRLGRVQTAVWDAFTHVRLHDGRSSISAKLTSSEGTGPGRAHSARRWHSGVSWGDVDMFDRAAQLAIAWLKLRRREPALRALHHLKPLQHRGGSFFGSYGKVQFTSCARKSAGP